MTNIFNTFRWLVFIFVHASIRETWANVTGCGLRSREGKVAHGLLVYVNASRVLGRTRVWCGYRIQRSVAVLLTLLLTCTTLTWATHKYASVGRHDIVRNELSLLPLSWRPSGLPKSREVWFMREHEIEKAQLQEEASWRMDRKVLWTTHAEKETEEKKWSNLLHVDASQMFSCMCSNTHLQLWP